MAVRVLIKHISKFFIIGISAVMVDFIVYYFLSAFLPVDISKSLGFLCGSTYTFYLNKKWNWRHKEKTDRNMLFRFSVIYGISLLCNVGINKFLLATLPQYYFSATLTDANQITTQLASFKANKFFAFFGATVFSAVLNFSGQKFWVFKSRATPELVVTVEETES